LPLPLSFFLSFLLILDGFSLFSDFSGLGFSSTTAFSGFGGFSALGGFSTLGVFSFGAFSAFSFFASFLFGFLSLDFVGLSGAGGATSSAKCTEWDEDGRDAGLAGSGSLGAGSSFGSSTAGASGGVSGMGSVEKNKKLVISQPT
jgi:hypothetical protein